MKKKVVPIIFAVDEIYAPFLGVTLKSIVLNCDMKNEYRIHVLNTGLKEETKKNLDSILPDNFFINFIDVKKQLSKIDGGLCLRDYYTNTTYYRFFIPNIFKEYDKVLYLDSDIILLDDVSKLFNVNLRGNLIGGVKDDVVAKFDAFKNYVEYGLNIKPDHYFNAGVVLMNLKAMREYNLFDKFISLSKVEKFDIAQDQDYLNVLCKDRVKLIDNFWNVTPFNDVVLDDNKVKLVHFKLSFKPWHYDDIQYASDFWALAKTTPFYESIKKVKDLYSEDRKINDKLSFNKLIMMAINYVNKKKYDKKRAI
ncbi:MAG: glycosyltransferase family 8 protein [Clostridiales bacterium]|nr:glycosyltransferase family 8 protein [Clostridiales bacterium]